MATIHSVDALADSRFQNGHPSSTDSMTYSTNGARMQWDINIYAQMQLVKTKHTQTSDVKKHVLSKKDLVVFKGF